MQSWAWPVSMAARQAWDRTPREAAGTMPAVKNMNDLTLRMKPTSCDSSRRSMTKKRSTKVATEVGMYILSAKSTRPSGSERTLQ